MFVYDHPIPLPSNKYEKDLETAAELQKVLLLINSINIFEKVMHMFKFLEFQERMNILNTTMAIAMSDLMHFFILFFLIFLGYAAMAFILFGPYLEGYRTFGRVTQKLGQTMIGDFDFEEIFEIDPLMASIMFWTFIILVFFTLVNVFLAILIDSYAEAKEESLGALGMENDALQGFRRLVAASKKKKQPAAKVGGDDEDDEDSQIGGGDDDPLTQALMFFQAKGSSHASMQDLRESAHRLSTQFTPSLQIHVFLPQARRRAHHRLPGCPSWSPLRSSRRQRGSRSRRNPQGNLGDI